MGDPVVQVAMPLDGIHKSLVDAAGACMMRWGISKTTVADLAAEAGCSRATVYRAFPGGKSQIMAVYGLCELQAFFAEASRLATEATTLEDALTDVIHAAAVGLAGHQGFQYMLAHEPGLVLPYLGFSNIDRLYRLATDALAGAFAHHAPGHATRLVELATRITLSHTFQPSATLDLCDPSAVRRLVQAHLLPIISPTVATDLPSVPRRDVLATPSPVNLAVPA